MASLLEAVNLALRPAGAYRSATDASGALGVVRLVAGAAAPFPARNSWDVDAGKSAVRAQVFPGPAALRTILLPRCQPEISVLCKPDVAPSVAQSCAVAVQ